MRLKVAEWKVEESRTHKGTEYRLALSGSAWTTHYMLTIFPAGLFSGCLILSIASFRDVKANHGWITFCLVTGTLAFLAWRAKRNDLRFKQYATQNDPISNCNVVRAFAEFHGWEVLREEEARLLQIGIPKSSVVSMTEGEILTVVFKGADVFVNCIPYPEGRSSVPSSWTRAKGRVQAVVTAVAGIPA